MMSSKKKICVLLLFPSFCFKEGELIAFGATCLERPKL